jgi:hypothetical protein
MTTEDAHCRRCSPPSPPPPRLDDDDDKVLHVGDVCHAYAFRVHPDANNAIIAVTAARMQ